MLTPGVVVTADSGLNAVAAYSCNEGYSLDGDQMRTCQRNGEWTGAAPTCICKLYPILHLRVMKVTYFNFFLVQSLTVVVSLILRVVKLHSLLVW